MLQTEYRDLAAEYVELVKAHFGDRLVSFIVFSAKEFAFSQLICQERFLLVG